MHSVVVISDLHIASGPLDDCDAELQSHFESFVDSLSRRDVPIELVVNGDFFDFVQAEPWSGSDLESWSDDDIPLCFTEAQSVAKLESIHASHPGIFDALKQFLHACPDNRITVLPGNHDVDFYWDRVRKRVCDYVGPVNFFLEQVYRPTPCSSVWIEHGHQSDPVNCFVSGKKPYWSRTSPPIFKDHGGTPRLYECTGTRFMIKFLNRLDQDYPFVDNVKPFSRFVKIFGASAFVRNYGTMKVAVAVGRMLAYLYATAVEHEADVLSVKKEAHNMVYEYLSRQFKMMPKARVDALVARMAEGGFIVEKPLTMYLKTYISAEPLLVFLCDHPELLDEIEVPDASFLGTSLPGTLTLATGFTVDETKELTETAGRALAAKDIDLVVMGHTHEVIQRSSRAYINTGCWIRYYRFDPNEKTVAWEVLKSDSYQRFPYELNYVEITPGKSATAQLSTFRQRHD